MRHIILVSGHTISPAGVVYPVIAGWSSAYWSWTERTAGPAVTTMMRRTCADGGCVPEQRVAKMTECGSTV